MFVVDVEEELGRVVGHEGAEAADVLQLLFDDFFAFDFLLHCRRRRRRRHRRCCHLFILEDTDQ